MKAAIIRTECIATSKVNEFAIKDHRKDLHNLPVHPSLSDGTSTGLVQEMIIDLLDILYSKNFPSIPC